MRYIFLFFLLATFAFTAIAQPNLKGFSQTESGIYYKLHKPAKGRKAEVNDHVTMHLVNKSASDSVIFSTYESSKEPIEFKLAAPQYNGDIMEGLLLMAAGDSATFFVPADSVYRNGMYPAFAGKGDWIKYDIKVSKVLSEQEYVQEQRKRREARAGIEEKQLQEYFSSNRLKEVKHLNEGMHILYHKKGKGPQSGPGQEVTVNYIGRLINGQEFDSSYKRNMPFTFTVGEGNVIEGWDMAFQQLREGDSATLFIPSAMAYGEREAGAIPSNSILIFDLKLEKVMDKTMQLNKDIERIKEHLAMNNIEAVQMDSGIFIATEKEGTGPAPQKGQKAVVHYRGKLLDGTEFDSSYKRGQPFEVPVGQNRVIKGWEAGLPQIKKGSKATLFIPSALAYGERGAPPTIPANAVLIFDIEMIDVK